VGFLAPWFLAGLAAIGLPVWLHLLKQHKTTPLPFSSLMFFERRTQSSIKHRRLRYLVLFALRTALVILLALAFARPFINSATVASAGGGKLLVLAVDNSFSMRQGDRLERAKTGAVQALSGLRPEDRALALTFGSKVHLLSDPTSDIAAVRAGLRAIRASDDLGSYAELTRALRSLAQNSRMPVEAHVFSDMQKSSLAASFADLQLGEGVTLTPHPVVNQRLANFTVERVFAPRRIYDPKKVQIQATITGYGTGSARKRVALVVNGRELTTKTVDVPAGGRATTEFLGLDAPYGMNRGEVRIDSTDAFANDDRFYFSAERSDPRPVLLVHEARETRGPLYFRTALESSRDAAFVLDVATVDQAANLSLSRFAFVVLSDVAALPEAFEQALRGYVRAGGSALVALGPSSAGRQKVLLSDLAIRDARYESREGERFATVTWLDSAHPATRRAANWTGVKFYRTVRVHPANSRVLARLSGDTPLLLESQVGEGRVLVLASTLDNVSNDFPLQAGFVPFIDEAAHYLAKLDEGGADYAVGSHLELHTAREPGAAIEVFDPTGARALSLTEATRAQNIRLDEAGFYEVRRPNGRNELVAVNADRRESDFELISRETLTLWQNTGQGSRTAAVAAGNEAERKPLDFWWYVMILVLLLAVAESLVGNRHLAVDKEAA